MFAPELVRDIRASEISRVASLIPKGARVLELGAGAGHQAAALAALGFSVTAIDIEGSIYEEIRCFPVRTYDGVRIPFADGSFDVVFSSNVLEHIGDLGSIHSEIKRVLVADGLAIHVLPTHVWRLWTTLTAFPSAVGAAWAFGAGLTHHCPIDRDRGRGVLLLARDLARTLAAPLRQRKHGERGNIFTEMLYFHPRWWRSNFRSNQLEIIREMPVGLFYTGNLVTNRFLTLKHREWLAGVFGSACHLFVLTKAGQKHG